MAITAVRNGSCSMGAVAEDFLEAEAGEDDVALEAGVVMLADEARKSSQRTKVTKRAGGKIHTAAFLFLKLNGCLLVCSGAICSETVGRSLLETCTVADTREVGAANVRGMSKIKRS
jgi:hypothetical protein